MKILFKKLRKYGWLILLLVLCTSAQAGAQMAVTGSVTGLVDYAMGNLSSGSASEVLGGELMRRTLMMFALAVSVAAFTVLSGFLSSRISSGLGQDLRSDVYRKIMSFSLGEADKFSLSRLISVSTFDVRTVQTALNTILISMIPAPFYAIFGFSAVAGFRSGMGWVIALVIFFTVVCTLVVYGRVIVFARSLDQKIDRMNGVIRESLTGVHVIRAFCKEEWSEERNFRVNSEYRDSSLKMNRNMQIFLPLINLITNMSSVLITWIGAYKVNENLLEVGQLIAFTSYVQLIVIGFYLLSSGAVQLPRLVTSSGRIQTVIREEPSIKSGDLLLPESSGIERLEFSGVGFRYTDDGGYVLKDISFTAGRGKVTAIIGDTGAGKSTIIRLIPRLYDVTCGSVKINGTDIREYDIASVRKRIGYVPQNGFLFTGDIASNISFGDDEKNPDRICSAAETAQASEFIDNKPEKYSAPVTRGGMNLSGGQRQRLAIARAIEQERDIYLFDDSFSALDLKTDRQVRKALKERSENAITLIVSQRISTVRDADQILVLENGKIVGTGSHSELLSCCRTYREIAKSQMTEADFEKDCEQAGI